MTWLPRYRDDDGFGMDVGSDGEYFLGHGVVGFEFILSEQVSSPSAVSCGSVWQPTTRDLTAAQQHQPFLTRPAFPHERQPSSLGKDYELARWAFGGTLDAEIQTKAGSSYVDLREDGTLTVHKVPIVQESGGRTFSIRLCSGRIRRLKP